jgi:hypothetical protein
MILEKSFPSVEHSLVSILLFPQTRAYTTGPVDIAAVWQPLRRLEVYLGIVAVSPAHRFVKV